ncbi:uncharacterized mitochondrial protein AtMg00810-like [Rutidosis leptorrhynchoides]|uniref:uncharacterized mitochondrial protein AtMg00810-like n=1 Tax=Rutidosis leptorrhynchoides TaxID=125765 RepID=UPI003A9923FE
MEQNLRLNIDDPSEEADASQYRCLAGRLLYPTVTRPDITYSINQLSQYLSCARQSHMDAAVCLLRYLKTTTGQGLFFPSTRNMNLMAYCDASWLSCPTTKRSNIGYYISIGRAPISWRTKKQSLVSCSSDEAEISCNGDYSLRSIVASMVVKEFWCNSR